MGTGWGVGGECVLPSTRTQEWVTVQEYEQNTGGGLGELVC